MMSQDLIKLKKWILGTDFYVIFSQTCFLISHSILSLRLLFSFFLSVRIRNWPNIRSFYIQYVLSQTSDFKSDVKSSISSALVFSSTSIITQIFGVAQGHIN